MTRLEKFRQTPEAEIVEFFLDSDLYEEKWCSGASCPETDPADPDDGCRACILAWLTEEVKLNG